MSDDPNTVHLEVDGVPVEGRKGQMIIEVTDAHETYVPRFCYHHKLSIAANCRMCLVEVEKAPKPLPACATPIGEGMKIWTRSPRAIAAQKATMEFLLINHPLDCPICDQGGECELQDLAMGFGRGISRYTEAKRSVDDENLGPLVSTDMTRCIHCTRCVRFGQEIAGIPTLGAMGRGEHMEISTFVEKTIDHELSANIIDLCPVGALNNKPFRYRARSWEMTQHALVSPHDCLGSNLWGHVHRGELLRMVPRENEAINETWIADRDRFSCDAVYHEDRLKQPRIRRDGEWVDTDWSTALEFAAERLRAVAADGGDALGSLASPSSTLEELYLLQSLSRALGSNNIDHRLRQGDVRDDALGVHVPGIGMSLDALEQLDAVLVVGSNVRREVPILAHRLRKLALAGRAVSFINPDEYTFTHPIAAYVNCGDAAGLVPAIARAVSAAAAATGADVPAALASVCDRHGTADDAAKHLAQQLLGGERRAVLVGALVQRHADGALLRALARGLATLTGAEYGELTEGANSAGAYLAGAVPHGLVGGAEAPTSGQGAQSMLANPRAGYLLLNVEPGNDCLDGEQAKAALAKAQCVVALSAFRNDELDEVADVILPVGTFAETDGTYVNASGDWQSVAAAARCFGESRPAWKVLRVLGTLLDFEGFDYTKCSQVTEQVRTAVESRSKSAVESAALGEFVVRGGGSSEWPMYTIDPLVRRATPLQSTAEGGQKAPVAI
ncbi:MAG: NADH-quinone oxidoreductase subunit NuoG [Pseudomonadota bacterium]